MHALRFVPLFGLALAVSCIASLGAAEPVDRLVHVSGKGVVKIVPDVAFIHFTIKTADDNLLRVREANDKVARTAMDLGKKNGAADDGFSVSQLDLTLDFNKQLNRPIYEVHREATIAVSDLAKLDALLAELLSQPNLTVTKISFETSKEAEYRNRALDRAVAEAKQKAKRLAELTGVKLGKARDIRIEGKDDSEQPFVTSVIPLVGAAEKAARERLPRDYHKPAPGGPLGRSAALGPRFHLVAYEVPDGTAGADSKAPVAGGKAPEGGKPFALGLIVIAVQVDIDFELGE